MSQENSEKSFFIDWPTLLAYVDWFRKAIDYLEAEGCVSGDLITEAKEKIAEAVKLIAVAVENNDKDKQDRAENLINEIKQVFFTMLDNCYNKYVGSRVG